MTVPPGVFLSHLRVAPWALTAVVIGLPLAAQGQGYEGTLTVRAHSGGGCEGKDLGEAHPLQLSLEDRGPGSRPRYRGYLLVEGRIPARFEGNELAALDVAYALSDASFTQGHRLRLSPGASGLAGELNERHLEASEEDECGWDRAEVALKAEATGATWKALEARFQANQARLLGVEAAEAKDEAKAVEAFEAALRYLGQAGGAESEEALELHIRLGMALDHLGRFPEAEAQGHKTLALSRRFALPEAEALALNNLGLSLDRRGEKEAAARFFEQALVLYRELGDRNGEAVTLRLMGQHQADAGAPGQAVALHQQALTLFRALGDADGEARSLNDLALLHDGLGDRDQALTLLNQALPIFRTLGDRTNEAMILNNLGLIFAHRGDPAKALTFYGKALAIHRSQGNLDGEATALKNIAEVHVGQGELREALAIQESVLQLSRTLKDRSGEAAGLHNLGHLFGVTGDNARALTFFEQALSLRKAIGDRNGEALTLNHLGLHWETQGEWEKAKTCFGQALLLFREGGDASGEATVLGSQGGLLVKRGSHLEARACYEQALQIRRRLGDRLGEAIALNDLGTLYDQLGDKAKALDCFQQALPIQREFQDRTNEAITLGNLGCHHDSLGDKAKARACFEQALALARATGRKGFEATTLSNLGLLFDSLGEKAKARRAYEQVLPLFRSMGDRRGEAIGLNNLGLISHSMGEMPEAMAHFQQALTTFQSLGDFINEGQVWNNLGSAHQSQGEAAAAIAEFGKAIPIFRRTGEKRGEAKALNNLGTVYLDLGDHATARQYLEQARTLFKETGDRAGEATTLNNLGQVHQAMGEGPGALVSFEQALQLERAVGDRLHEGTTLNNLGALHAWQGEGERARSLWEQALAIHGEVGNRSMEARTLNNLGVLLQNAGVTDQALRQYAQALQTCRMAEDRSTEAITLSNMMNLQKITGHPWLAIIWGKQAVNTLQNLRGNLRSLDKDLQKSFLAQYEDSYRMLIGLLLDAKRVDEALQVLAMLKEEEYLGFAGGFAGAKPSLAPARTEIPYLDWERPWVERLATEGLKLGRLRQQRDALARQAKLELAGVDPDQDKALDQEWGAAKAAFGRVMTELTAALGRPDFKPDPPKAKPRIENLQAALARLGDGGALLQTVASADGLWTILVSSGSVQVHREARQAGELNLKIQSFRTTLRDPRQDPRPLGKELYDLLLAPFEAELKGTKTLMVGLDGALRYLPVSALYDGQRYLIERLPVANYTELATGRMLEAVSPAGDFAGLGLTREVEGFGSLPAVRQELEGIVKREGRGILPGRIHLDEAFTAARFQAEAQAPENRVLHVASHFVFRPGTDADSFLLLGDASRMTLRDLKDCQLDLKRLDLVVLSACDTASGGKAATGVEVEGLAVIMAKQGAKGVLATLWPVADASTGQLMQTFYRLRADQGLTKAEALRQAQMAFIQGAGGRDGANGPRGVVAVAVTYANGFKAFIPDAKAPYAHPYYWAPFILMGNWR